MLVKALRPDRGAVVSVLAGIRRANKRHLTGTGGKIRVSCRNNSAGFVAALPAKGTQGTTDAHQER
jgi:hypothetical protein